MNALIKKIKNSIFFLFLLPCLAVNAQNPLTPLKLDTPRDTLKMFMNSMNDYKKGVDKNDEEKKLQIDNAMRCLDLREISPLLREEKGKEAAIFLKEAIDRVYIMDLNKVPDTDSLPKWAIPDTEITILKNTTGSRVGEYLFSAETVLNAGDYYKPALYQFDRGIFDRTHNKFFDLLAMGGIVTLLLYLCSLVFFVRNIVSLRKDHLWVSAVLFFWCRCFKYFWN
jgi:hypothetical protein